MWSVYGMVLTGEIVECLRNGIDRGKCGVLRYGTDREKVMRQKIVFMRN